MFRFIATRLIQFPLILAVIYLITFSLAWVAPGSPFERERPLPPEMVKSLKERYNADSAWSFLTTYPVRMIQGDFGPSFTNEAFTVDEIIANSLPISVQLGLLATAIAVVVGVLLGTLAAVRRGKVLDWLSLTVALIGISTPSFVVAMGLLGIFAFSFTIFPMGGWGGFSEMVLPAIALSLLPMAYITRLMRVSMIDVLGADFMRTARAKGVSRTWVIFKHGLRNAILPVVSFLGPAAAAAMTGSFVVEKVFDIPGLGTYFVKSVTDRDQPMILGVVMIYSVILLTLNLLVDISYGFIDPRIQVGGKS